MGQPLRKTEARPSTQQFVWMNDTWDISGMLNDIGTGKLKPKAGTLGRDFIEQYGKQVLCLNKAEPSKSGVSFFMHVDVERALALPTEALKEPVIFINRGKNKGILKLDAAGGTDHLLGDGNHRVAKAYIEDTPQLNSFLLSPAQSRKYKIS